MCNLPNPFTVLKVANRSDRRIDDRLKILKFISFTQEKHKFMSILRNTSAISPHIYYWKRLTGIRSSTVNILIK